MADFITRTWFVWWAVAVIIVVRWFQVATPEVPSLPDTFFEEDAIPAASRQFSSSRI
jgi:hypothetical protein